MMENFTELTREETINFLLKLLQGLRLAKVSRERQENLKRLIIKICGVESDGLLNLNNDQYDVFIGDEDADL